MEILQQGRPTPIAFRQSRLLSHIHKMPGAIIHLQAIEHVLIRQFQIFGEVVE
uniref:hypothetical protein n=1 Tax=Croceimicrobium hydrocarbonivorans TaxID=2761580 RepID=UPI00389929AA